MQKITFFICLLTIAFLIQSCELGSSSDNSENSSDSASVLIAQPDTEAEGEIQDSSLYEIAITNEFDAAVSEIPGMKKAKSETYELLRRLHYVVQRPEVISSEKRLHEAYAMRDTLVSTLYDPLMKASDQDPALLAQDKYFEFFDKLGLQIVTAEGMYIGLSEGPLLPEKTEALGSDVFKLFQQFKSAYGSSQGSEYPFLNVTERTEIVRLGEEMEKRFPNHELTAQARPILDLAMHDLSDIHRVMFKGAETFNCFALTLDAYPYMTDQKLLETFAENGNGTEFHKITRKILENISTIRAGEDGAAEVYAIVLSRDDNFKEAQKRCIDFMRKGQDVPHSLSVKDQNGSETNLVTYRYYPTKSEAEKMLSKAQAFDKNAQVLHLKQEKYEWFIQE